MRCVISRGAARQGAGPRLVFALCGVVVSLLVAVPAASAVTRHVHPNGVMTGSDCTNPDPNAAMNPACSLEFGVETVALGTDEVVIASGNYSLTDSLLVSSANVHGATGQPIPIITTSSLNEGILISGGTLSDIRVDYTGPNNAIFVNGTVERVFAHAANTVSGTACNLGNGALIRDSVCWSEAGNGAGNGVLFSHGLLTMSADLRNVTAVATGLQGLGILVSTGTGNLTLDVKNSIALGDDANGGADAFAEAGAGGTANLMFEHSNYDSEEEQVTGGTVTDPGTGTGNQIDPPAFASGDFHQLATSPTINAGFAVDMLGTGDFENQARTLQGTPDIGADEYSPPAVPGGSTTTPAVVDPCPPLRAKLAKLNRKIKRASGDRKAKLKGKRRKVRRQLRALGC
jgi:hypothetical protein